MKTDLTFCLLLFRVRSQIDLSPRVIYEEEVARLDAAGRKEVASFERIKKSLYKVRNLQAQEEEPKLGSEEDQCVKERRNLVNKMFLMKKIISEKSGKTLY